MAKDVEVKIVAHDGATQTFQQVGSSAETMGKRVEQSGSKASDSLKKMQQVAGTMGAAIGAAALLTSKAAAESEASAARLETAFTNAGYSLSDFQERIDQLNSKGLSLAFDDEDVQDSISNLITATGDAERAFGDLSIAQDIARARNISLAEATNIVIAAETGRFRSLKAMGIVLDENATSQEALAALQTKYAGSAQAYSETSAASYERLGNAIENYMETAGGFINQNGQMIMALGGLSSIAGPAAGGVLAMAAALGPVGLAAGALAAGAGVIYLTTQLNRYDDAAVKASLATDNLDNFFQSLAANMSPAVAASLLEFNKNLDTLISDAATRQSDLDKLLTVQMGITNEGIDLTTQAAADLAAEVTGLTVEQLKWIDTNKDLHISVQEVNDAVVLFQANADRLSADQIDATSAAITDLLSKPNVDIFRVVGVISSLNEQLDAGTITGEEYVAALEDMSVHYGQYIKSAQDATEATNALTQAMTKQAERGAEADAYWEKHTANVSKGFENVAHAADTGGVALSNYTEELATLAASLQDVGASGLDRYMNMIVGFTDGIVDSIGGAQKWADALIAPVGTYSELDNLLKDGRISLDEYNAAQQAQVDITEAYNRASIDRNQIQAQQSPLIAMQADAAADYLDVIAQMPAHEQAIALAWADQDMSGRVIDITNMASQYSEMGDAGKAAFEDMVLGAAAADPALATVLESTGLIKRDLSDPTGWALNIDAADGQSAVETLVDSIQDLIDTLNQVYNLEVTTTFDDTSFWQAYNSLPDSKAINVYTTGGQSYGPTKEAIGGVNHFAKGGIVHLAELGPEMLRFPSGAIGMAPVRGNYMVPDGTHVATAAATASTLQGMGGGTIVQNGPFYITPERGETAGQAALNFARSSR